MLMRVLAPRPRPTAVPGTFLSLAAHGALLAATVAGGGPPGLGVRPAGGADDGVSDGERLHWVGVGGGSGAARARAPRRDARPPVAYLVPGRSGGVAAVGRGARGSAGDRGGGARGEARGANRGSAAPAALRATTASAPNVREPSAREVKDVSDRELSARRAGARRPSLFRRVRSAAIPEVVIPEAELTRLAAGVLSSAPDLARRAVRAGEFVPTPAALLGELVVRTNGADAFAGDVHLHDLPIPLVSNRPPEYPDALARAGVGGRVVVEFLIDSTGDVDAGTLRVVESSDWRFTEAVRGSLAALHFAPALRGERPVGVTVRQPFVFAVRPGP